MALSLLVAYSDFGFCPESHSLKRISTRFYNTSCRGLPQCPNDKTHFFFLYCTFVVVSVSSRMYRLWIGACFLRLNRHFLLAALAPGSLCHCSQESVRRPVARVLEISILGVTSLPSQRGGTSYDAARCDDNRSG